MEKIFIVITLFITGVCNGQHIGTVDSLKYAVAYNYILSDSVGIAHSIIPSNDLTSTSYKWFREALEFSNNKAIKDLMHEVTEAYQGALISQRAGVGVGPATMADVNNPMSVYNRAHNTAISQSGIVGINIYDSRGVAVSANSPSARRAEWVVYPQRQNPLVIMRLP